jgi:hypothetical protein
MGLNLPRRKLRLASCQCPHAHIMFYMAAELGVLKCARLQALAQRQSCCDALLLRRGCNSWGRRHDQHVGACPMHKLRTGHVTYLHKCVSWDGSSFKSRCRVKFACVYLGDIIAPTPRRLRSWVWDKVTELEGRPRLTCSRRDCCAIVSPFYMRSSLIARPTMSSGILPSVVAF